MPRPHYIVTSARGSRHKEAIAIAHHAPHGGVSLLSTAYLLVPDTYTGQGHAWATVNEHGKYEWVKACWVLNRLWSAYTATMCAEVR